MDNKSTALKTSGIYTSSAGSVGIAPPGPNPYGPCFIDGVTGAGVAPPGLGDDTPGVPLPPTD